jgi:toxin CcdB
LARYDVWDNPAEGGLLLEVQADVLSEYSSRVVIPLVPAAAHKNAGRLNPVVMIGETEWMVFTQYVSAVPKAVLKRRIANLAEEHFRIVAALDFLFTGV